MKYMLTPDITLYEGVVASKDTKLDYKYETETMKFDQKVEGLLMTTKQTIKGERWTRTQTVKLKLNEGDLLIKDVMAGWLLPETDIDTIDNVIKDLEAIKE